MSTPRYTPRNFCGERPPEGVAKSTSDCCLLTAGHRDEHRTGDGTRWPVDSAAALGLPVEEEK